MNIKRVDKFTVTLLGGIERVEDIVNVPEIIVGTITGVGELTGIERHRLVYKFTRKGCEAIIEKNYLIKKVQTEYVGNRRGGDKSYKGYNRFR